MAVPNSIVVIFFTFYVSQLCSIDLGDILHDCPVLLPCCTLRVQTQELLLKILARAKNRKPHKPWFVMLIAQAYLLHPIAIVAYTLRAQAKDWHVQLRPAGAFPNTCCSGL